jgi:Uma2 family endonuclease
VVGTTFGLGASIFPQIPIFGFRISRHHALDVNEHGNTDALHDAAAVEPVRCTYDELLARIPESNRPSELWDGELIMSPAPSLQHQKIALAFYRRLHEWVARHDLGEVYAAPLDMVLSPHCVMQPDVAFVARDRLDVARRAIEGPADLVAEVISLGGRERDRIRKRDLYEQHGVKEYWIIDPEPRTIEVLVLDTAGYRRTGCFRSGDHASSRLLPGFEAAVDELFEGIRGGV